MKERQLTKKNKAMTNPYYLYDIVYADPWPHIDETSEEIAPHARDISGIDVRHVIAPKSFLFLWAPTRLLPEGLAVMKAWGFTYKMTAYIRYRPAKLPYGVPGVPVSGSALCLLGTRGGATVPTNSPQSINPGSALDMLADLFPNQHKLALFTDESTDGWDTWSSENVTTCFKQLRRSIHD